MSPWGINRKHAIIYLAIMLLIYVGAMFLLPSGKGVKENKNSSDSVPDSNLKSGIKK